MLLFASCPLDGMEKRCNLLHPYFLVSNKSTLYKTIEKLQLYIIMITDYYKKTKPTLIGTYAITVILIVLAMFLRFYKLGEWSFYPDEVATQCEVQNLFDHSKHSQLPESVKAYPAYNPDPEKSQFYRLPRLIFVAHFVHWLDYRLFGNDEWGSRVLMAIMGSLSVGIAFFLGRSLFGFSGSLILSLLILLSPEHVYYSQFSRFYSQGFLLIEIIFLLGAYVAVKKSVAAAWALVPISILMVFSHSLSGLVWGMLLGGLLVDFFFSGQSDSNQSNIKTKEKLFLSKIPYKVVFILCITSIVLLLIFLFHIMPLAKSWNHYYMPGRASSVDTVLTFAATLGQSYFLLCVPAWFFMLFHVRNIGWGYWLFCASACGLAIFLLPLKMVLLPWYAFLFEFPFFVILALFIDRIGQLLAQSFKRYGLYCGIVWCCFMVSLNIFALKNYYKDGERYNIRAACQYINQNLQSGDLLLCNEFVDVIDIYIQEDGTPIMLREKDMFKYLQQVFNEIKRNNDKKSNHSRFWIIIGREKFFLLDKETRHWINNYCQHEGSFGNFRYNTPKYLEVFLCSPGNGK
ncbi:MAG: glycosyltransferase family 39 protein [Planctomycetaceae bacterium]|nr:glycosyltransferase family 39 protein [Planctomycetaceae bacterium]